MKCSDCIYWKHDLGMFTATGWTGSGRNEGHCHFDRSPIRKHGDDFCHEFVDKREKPKEEAKS